MKALRLILVAVYVILATLLLLNNCFGCRDTNIPEPRPLPQPLPQPIDTTLVDTTYIVPVDTTIVEMSDTIGRSGDLKVTLMWDFKADIDLHVKQPNGETIYFNNKEDSATGGRLDVDNQIGGDGSAENIYWENPPEGTYEVRLKYYSDSRYDESGKCLIVVQQKGMEPRMFQVDMNERGEMKFICEAVVN